MDTRLIFLPFLLVFQLAFSQEVKFTNGQFPNELIYPIVSLTGNPDAEKTLNENILSIVSEYENQDYCIGQYGYVQQTNFLQIQFYFNCIDMDESKNEIYLFSLANGQPCPPSEMFVDNQRKKYREFFRNKIASHFTENGKETPSNEFLESLTIDDCTIQLLEDGIEISLSTDANWPAKNLMLTWIEIRPYLKTTFI